MTCDSASGSHKEASEHSFNLSFNPEEGSAETSSSTLDPCQYLNMSTVS